ncbi:MAG: DUF4124 domain-containing protein [Cocleimonas sp.]
MKTLAPLYCALLLIVSQSAVHADGLYKWKDARGNTQYGDRPPANVNAKSIDLPKITIIDNYADQWKPIKFDEPQTDTAVKAKPKVSKTYTKLAFLAPKQGQGIRANNGDVSAMISIKPPLKKGHQLVFSVDGEIIGKGKSRTQNFSNLNRGSHTIGVKVIDKRGKTLKSSSVGFNVLRTNGLSKTQANTAPQKLPQARSYNAAKQ